MSRILAIDFGTKRIGLALSDESGTLSSPLYALKNKTDVIQEIILVASEYNIKTIVIGKPLTLGGKEGDTLKQAEFFGDQLKRALPEIQIEWQDERLSSQEVSLQRIRSGWSQKKRQSKKDAQAAANFLQTYLDKKKSPAQ